jgi:protein disulfide-isomerase
MNLKTTSSIFIAATLAHSAIGANWITDLKTAQEQARKDDKLILVNFTGSDWCGWCIKLKNEVFSQPEFDAFASDHLILLEIDFPRQKPMPAAVKRANGALADKYKVGGYPTLHVLDADGTSLGFLGYIPGGPKAFLAKVKSIGGDRLKATTVAAKKPAQPEAEPEPAGPPPPAFNGAPTFPPKQYAGLELKGISGPPNARLALINNQTLGAGETGKVKLGSTVVKVKCLEVRDDAAIVMVDGANERRELRMREAP